MGQHGHCAAKAGSACPPLWDVCLSSMASVCQSRSIQASRATTLPMHTLHTHTLHMHTRSPLAGGVGRARAAHWCTAARRAACGGGSPGAARAKRNRMRLTLLPLSRLSRSARNVRSGPSVLTSNWAQRGEGVKRARGQKELSACHDAQLGTPRLRYAQPPRVPRPVLPHQPGTIASGRVALATAAVRRLRRCSSTTDAHLLPYAGNVQSVQRVLNQDALQSWDAHAGR